MADNPHLEPTSVVALLMYSMLLASGLLALAMDFPKFHRKPQAISITTLNVAEPLASTDETIGHR
jgi:hypothetical protein